MVEFINRRFSREMRRNRGRRGDRPKQAHHLAQPDTAGKKVSAPEFLSPHGVWLRVCCQTTGVLSKSADGLIVNIISQSVMNLFTSLFLKTNKGAEIFTYHLGSKKQPRKRYGSTTHRGQLVDRVSIDKRSAIVDTRSQIGDWELDTIIGRGHKPALVSMTERRSRLTLMAKVKPKNAALVSWSI